MKKTLKAILCLALCSVMLLALVGCGNTKKDDWTKGILGEWKRTSASNRYNIYTFYPNGTGKCYETTEGSSAVSFFYNFNWTTVEPNKIIIVIGKNESRKEIEYYDNSILVGEYYYYKVTE